MSKNGYYTQNYDIHILATAKLHKITLMLIPCGVFAIPSMRGGGIFFSPESRIIYFLFADKVIFGK
jgi:hypothetical protein